MKYRLFLVLATIIWGSSFVIVKNTTDVMDPAWILALRFPAAALILAVVFFKKRALYFQKDHMLYGAVFGVVLFLAYLTQTIGITDTTPGKNAFLTSTYVVIVPFLAVLVTRERLTIYNVAAAILCIVGIGFVSLSSDLKIGFGDALTLLCALFYAIHICLVARFSRGRDIYVLTMWQFATTGALALIVAFVGGTMPQWDQIPLASYAGVAYLAVFCTAIALLLQNIGQSKVPAATAALLLSLESVFGVLFSVLLGAEVLSLRVLIGFTLIFTAIVVSETQGRFLRVRKGKLESKEEEGVMVEPEDSLQDVRVPETLPEFFEYPEAMFGGAEVFVLEDEEDGTPIRVLYVGGGFQSATYIDERRFDLVFEYYKAFDVMFDHAPAQPIRSVLMLGSGGCSYVKYLVRHFDDIHVDAVEIDPVVLEIARKHFYVDELLQNEQVGDRLQLIACDGRAYLEGTDKRYDAILNDSFSGLDLVRELASLEAARCIKQHLNPGGIYLANVVSADMGADISKVQAVATTLHEVFGHVAVLPCFDEDYAGEDNYLVVASDASLNYQNAVKTDQIFAGDIVYDPGL